MISLRESSSAILMMPTQDMYTFSTTRYPPGEPVSVVLDKNTQNQQSGRQLAESTNTDVLDNLIAQYPHRLEYLRTRGIVHCFRDEYSMATKDFTQALREARVRRKAKSLHNSAGSV